MDGFLTATLGGLLDGYFYPFILDGMLLTVEVALLSLLVAVALGIVAALARLSSSQVAQTLAGVYTTIVRGVPDIVLMFILFFGGQLLLNSLGAWLSEVSAGALGWTYLEISQFTAGVATIGVIFGAYMGETFRGGILAVPRGEIEAGYAFGMSAAQVFFRITFPAAVRHALPGFGNNWLVLTKSTALVSVIGLHDMLYRAAQAGNTVRKPFTFYLAAAVLYLLLTAVSDVVLRRLDKRYSAGVRSA